MSANSGRLRKGLKVIHEGKEKIVKDWFWTSDTVSNSDVINIRFEDGTGCQGFNSDVSKTTENYVNANENVIAAVEKNGVPRFLEILKSGQCKGRDIQMLIEVIEKNYTDGFMVVG